MVRSEWRRPSHHRRAGASYRQCAEWMPRVRRDEGTGAKAPHDGTAHAGSAQAMNWLTGVINPVRTTPATGVLQAESACGYGRTGRALPKNSSDPHSSFPRKSRESKARSCGPPHLDTRFGGYDAIQASVANESTSCWRAAARCKGERGSRRTEETSTSAAAQNVSGEWEPPLADDCRSLLGGRCRSGFAGRDP